MQNGIALAKRSRLEEYEIEGELGSGTFGVTYLAMDTNLGRKVVIKEYLPNEIAIRQDVNTIIPKSKGDQENFNYGLESFIKEAKVLARFNHPNIVKVNRLFEVNNTAYFVMDYEEGEDLQDYINRNSSFSEQEIIDIIMSILDGLREVHNTDFLHRDIKPGNIYLRKYSSPMLIDFGASRMAMGVKSKSLSVVLTEGYAPKEQYSSTSKQGSYTDIYAIGAVMYKMATGITPPESTARADSITDDEPDPFVTLQSRDDLNYSDTFKKAVDWALELRGKDRPQSVREFQQALDSVSFSPYQKQPHTSKPILDSQKHKNNLKVKKDQEVVIEKQASYLHNSNTNHTKEEGNYYLRALKKYAVFQGRATRSEYWWFTLINILIAIVFLVIDINLIGEPLLLLIYQLFILLPSFAILARRLHDINKSAWWILIVFLPYIGGIVLFVFTLLKSDENNEYGEKRN